MKSNFQHVTIFYYSGTGNSYRVAAWAAEAARQAGADARTLSISQSRPESEIPEAENGLLGLCFPTHAFTAPWPVVRFALSLPKRAGTQAIIIPTRGGMKLGRFILDGMEGTGGYLLALILRLKGYRVVGVRAMNMPSNWIVLYPGCTHDTVEAIERQSLERLADFMSAVLSGKSQFRGMVALILGILLLPLTAGYVVLGRYWLAKLFYATENCTGCGLCADHCPESAIRMRGKKNPRPFWTYSCVSCMRCMNYCPHNAIEASYPLGIGLYFLCQVPMAYLLLRWLGQRLGLGNGLQSLFLSGMLQYAFVLLAFALAYWVFTLLVRVPAINRLLTALTPTRYYRRYHEPATALADLSRGDHDS